MNRIGLILLMTMLLVLSAGCARRAGRVVLPDVLVPVKCASEIRLLQCDARVSPPKCRSARVVYRRGCEEILAVK
jgi:hypothetical protein